MLFIFPVTEPDGCQLDPVKADRIQADSGRKIPFPYEHEKFLHMLLPAKIPCSAFHADHSCCIKPAFQNKVRFLSPLLSLKESLQCLFPGKTSPALGLFL